jgi:hypothetical protein
MPSQIAPTNSPVTGATFSDFLPPPTLSSTNELSHLTERSGVGLVQPGDSSLQTSKALRTSRTPILSPLVQPSPFIHPNRVLINQKPPV